MRIDKKLRIILLLKSCAASAMSLSAALCAARLWRQAATIFFPFLFYSKKRCSACGVGEWDLTMAQGCTLCVQGILCLNLLCSEHDTTWMSSRHSFLHCSSYDQRAIVWVENCELSYQFSKNEMLAVKPICHRVCASHAVTAVDHFHPVIS